MSTSQNSDEPKAQSQNTRNRAIVGVVSSAGAAMIVSFCGSSSSSVSLLSSKGPSGPDGVGLVLFFLTPLAAPVGILGGFITYKIGSALPFKKMEPVYWIIGGVIGGLVVAAMIVNYLILPMVKK